VRINLTLVRYLTAAAIAIVLVVLLAVVGIAVARGTDINSSQLLGLLSFVGILVGLVVSLVNGSATAAATQDQAKVLTDVQEKVNGHLERHLGHTDQGVREIVDEMLQQRLGPPPAGAGGV
jgi:uncharacterized membrane protein YgaE (UPF0421/DUF939 family)